MPTSHARRSRGGPMFRATQIAGYAKLASARGIGVKSLLAGTGLNHRDIEAGACVVSMEQYHATVSNLMRLTGDPGIAFDIGDRLELDDLGIVGYALLSSRSMRQALGIWMQYSQSLIGSPIRLNLDEHRPTSWSLRIAAPMQSALLQRFCTEEFLVQGLRLFGLLAGHGLSLRSLSLSYPEPSHRSLYEQRFACPLRFNAPQTVFSVREPGLDLPLATGNPELHELCWQHCRQVMRHLPHAGAERSHLRSLFLSAPSGLPSVNEAASRLGFSSRTLRRQLHADGHSYRQLKHEFRLDLALQYLESGHFAIKEVAHMLGYTSASAFCRAFKRWTGSTVSQYLQNPAPNKI